MLSQAKIEDKLARTNTAIKKTIESVEYLIDACRMLGETLEENEKRISTLEEDVDSLTEVAARSLVLISMLGERAGFPVYREKRARVAAIGKE